MQTLNFQYMIYFKCIKSLIEEVFIMIKIEELTFPSADMGEVNPLADIYNIEYIHARYELTENISKEDKKHIGKGMINSILPYTIQDNYNRDRKPRTFKAVVLENEFLKATFLPELGARLWSLFDKEHNKELLYKNPVFQPANLAIRNAWFSGGVEFNVGIKGHNMLTCENYFTRIATTKDGEEVVQLYEYERVRGVAFGINAYLPKGSKALYLKDTIENLSDSDTWTYWWSNIAVPDTKGTRVIVPTNRSFKSMYDDGHYILDKIDIPYHIDLDVSYPKNLPRSLDFFYEIPKEAHERWITAIPEDGVGLLQASTKEMIGKKLFVWGQGVGGKNWGNWLSDGTGGYIEIQSGLAYTQLEHIPMAKNSTLSWTECYTALPCNTEKAFSNDWSQAVDEIKNCLHLRLDTNDLEVTLKNAVPEDFISYKVLTLGSGYAYQEEQMRGKKLTNIYEFYPNSATKMQEDWLYLVKNGVLPEKPINHYPISYVIGKGWKDLLEKSVLMSNGNHWYAWYHIGVVRYQLMDFDGAKEAFLTSANLKENAWALRNLAMIARHDKNYDNAVKYIEKAVTLVPELVSLYIDYMRILLDAKLYDKAILAYSNFPQKAKERARIRLQLAVAYLNTMQYEKASEIINADFMMEDIREGEVSVSHIWSELYQAIVKKEHPELEPEEICRLQEKLYPLPEKLDFRMH